MYCFMYCFLRTNDCCLYVFHNRRVTESIRHLCKFSMHNAMLCSTSGVFSKVVMLLESEAQNIDVTWAGSLHLHLFIHICLQALWPTREQGWCSRENACLPTMWHLGSNLGPDIISWLSLLLVLVLTLRVVLWVLWLSSLLRNQHSKF